MSVILVQGKNVYYITALFVLCAELILQKNMAILLKGMCMFII